jgi:hypothetical protein
MCLAGFEGYPCLEHRRHGELSISETRALADRNTQGKQPVNKTGFSRDPLCQLSCGLPAAADDSASIVAAELINRSADHSECWQWLGNLRVGEPSVRSKVAIGITLPPAQGRNLHDQQYHNL